MIKHILTIGLVGLLAFAGCNKEKRLVKLEGNNKNFKETSMTLNEVIFMKVPNTILGNGLSGWGACQDIPFGQIIDYTAFIPTENPNPYGHLAKNIIPNKVTMELTGVESCDFSMLGDLVVYVCDNGVTNPSNFVFRDPANPDMPYNAVKLGERLNIPESATSVIDLDLENQVVLDQFIHAGTFQIYVEMTIDKAFTDSYAIIRTDMNLSAQLINEK